MIKKVFIGIIAAGMILKELMQLRKRNTAEKIRN